VSDGYAKESESKESEAGTQGWDKREDKEKYGVPWNKSLVSKQSKLGTPRDRQAARKREIFSICLNIMADWLTFLTLPG